MPSPPSPSPRVLPGAPTDTHRHRSSRPGLPQCPEPCFLCCPLPFPPRSPHPSRGTCVHTHTHAYTRAHVHTRMDTYTHMHTRMHTCIHTSIRAHMHGHIRTRTLVCTHAWTHIHTHAYTRAQVHTCMGTYTHMHTHAHRHARMHRSTRTGLAPSFKLGSSLVSTSPRWGTSSRCKSLLTQWTGARGASPGLSGPRPDCWGAEETDTACPPRTHWWRLDAAAHASHHPVAVALHREVGRSWGPRSRFLRGLGLQLASPGSRLLQPPRRSASRWARGPPGGTRHPF